jgi:hypothetical protein
MRTIIYLLPFLLIISACSRTTAKQKRLVYYNDFENIKGWTNPPLVLKKHIAHSGVYSNKLDTGVAMYGGTFRLKFKDIIATKIKKVKLSFWVLLADPKSKGKFVIDISGTADNNLFWIAKDIDTSVAPHGKWTQVRTTYTFVETNITAPNNIIKIYPWNDGKKEFYIDDVELEFVI